MRIIALGVFMLATFLNAHALEMQSWAIIDNKAVNISKGSCRLKFGLFSNERSCQCCLAQGLYKGKSAPSAILNACLKKNCPRKVIEENFSPDIQSGDDTAIAAKIKEFVPFVHFMDLGKIPFTTPLKQQKDDSYLLEDHVKELVRYLAENEFIDLPQEQTSGNCLQVKSLTEGKGYNTGQLFSIKVNRNCEMAEPKWQQVFIFKEVTQGLDELLNLEKIKNHPKISLAMKGKGPEGLPAITRDLINFKVSLGKKAIYFSLLQSARGKPLSAWIKEYGEALKKPNEKLPALQQTMEEMFYQVGSQLSKLHQYLSVKNDKKHTTRSLLKNTIIHGDFHANNIFYDADEKKVYLIDNESMAKSFRRMLPGSHELAYLYTLTTFKTIAYKASDQFNTNLTLNIPDKTWHHLWQKLIVGYISAYPQEAWDSLIKEMHKSFVQHLQYLKSTNFTRFFDKRFLALLFGERGRRSQLIKKAIPSMFEGVRQDLMEMKSQEGDKG